MGATTTFTAALKKGDQEDHLILTNGEEVSLPASLPYPDGTKLVVHVTPKDGADGQGSTLAKQILQEILSGE